jgi:hypothetical protein
MALVGNSFNIPHFITALSPEGLRRKLLDNNLKNGTEFNYYQIIFDGKNWVAWYYKEAQEKPKLTKNNGD